MVRTVRQPAIVGGTQRNRVAGELMMPNGERVFVLNREAYRSAVQAADGKLNKILEGIQNRGPAKHDAKR